MNSNKVIIMEIKDDYAIAMTPEFEFIKIKKKKNMQEGQKIYIVDEDICYSDEKVPFFKNKKFMKGLGLISILVGVILAFLLLNPFKNDKYAVVSLDGASSIEMELDENKHVVEATSRNNSIPIKDLEYIDGETLDDAIDHVKDMLENDNYVLAGYSISDENNIAYGEDVKSIIQEHLSYVIFMDSDMEDVKSADSKDMTLGQYLLKYVDSLEDFESCIENKIDYDRLDRFVLANSKFIENGEKIRKEIFNEKNQSKNNYGSISDEDNDDDDQDEDDDDDDD